MASRAASWYSLDASTSTFVVGDYNRAPAFSDFLPGVAGRYGVPVWAFWVNRAQLMSGVGAGGRDGQIQELYSFNKACTRVATEGFRTFIRVDGRMSEPFRPGAPDHVTQELRVSPADLEIVERNEALGIEVRVVFHTMPNRRIGGLVRNLTLRDLSGSSRRLEVVDGAPRILPYGLDEAAIKGIPRHVEAMFTADGTGSVSLFRLRQTAADEAAVGSIDGAHYYAAWADGGSLSMAVDPKAVFADAFAFDRPIRFAAGGVEAVRDSSPRLRGRTPCALSVWEGWLGAEGTIDLVSVIGRADEATRIADELTDLSIGTARRMRADNRLLLDEIADRSFTVSASPTFDAYCGQNFLDNVLRGGMPVQVGEAGPVVHVFGRQNFDLERDYHRFTLPATYLSHDMAHYRNALQNRRDHAWFFPEGTSTDLEIFFGLIQLDGYNPLEVLPASLSVADAAGLEARLAPLLSGGARELLTVRMTAGPFSPGRLVMWLEEALGSTPDDAAGMLPELLPFLAPGEVGGLHAGYWIDHWHYLLDLLESLLGAFPERLRDVLTTPLSWFDDPDVVVPRRVRYRDTLRGPRQLGSVVRDQEKESAIAGRGEPRFRVRTPSGEVLVSPLVTKLVLIAATRLATLDVAGVGVEMEAGKPGWNDSLNGLPSLFGSGVGEAVELRRLLRLLEGWVQQLPGPAVAPAEVVDFVERLQPLLERRAAGQIDGFAYWEAANGLKEEYRERVRLGIGGLQRPLSHEHITKLCGSGLGVLQLGFERSESFAEDGVPATYLRSAPRFEDGMPTGFDPEPVGLFLEGAVHWIREFPDQAARVHEAVRSSPLFDEALAAYRSSGPMGGADPELGRAVGAYPPGWLENQSIYTHMEYKYLLELLRSGMAAEFWAGAATTLIPFLDPAVYGRSPLQGSSFIVSSAFADATEHGRGYQPRLSGMTAEFISMWLVMCLGSHPFRVDGDLVSFTPEPRLPGWLFTRASTRRSVADGGRRRDLEFPAGCFAFRGPGGTIVRYVNPTRAVTYGPDGVLPVEFGATWRDGTTERVVGGSLTNGAAVGAFRSGSLDQLEIRLGPPQDSGGV